MNKWFKCKKHGGYFPATTIQEHQEQKCLTCLRYEEWEKKQVITEYMESHRFE